MKTNFQPTEEEEKSFMRQTRGAIQRRIEPQPWDDGSGLWKWKTVDSPREFDVAWVEGMADDMLDAHCPHAKRGRVLWTNERGEKVKATDVRAERLADGWFWVIMWRAA